MIDHDNLEEFADPVAYDRQDSSDTGVAFYAALARETGGPVEIACGTGRVAIPIAREGFAVTGLRELAFFSTVTTFGAPLDVTVQELAIESFPADPETAAALRELLQAGTPPAGAPVARRSKSSPAQTGMLRSSICTQLVSGAGMAARNPSRAARAAPMSVTSMSGSMETAAVLVAGVFGFN